MTQADVGIQDNDSRENQDVGQKVLETVGTARL